MCNKRTRVHGVAYDYGQITTSFRWGPGPPVPPVDCATACLPPQKNVAGYLTCLLLRLVITIPWNLCRQQCHDNNKQTGIYLNEWSACPSLACSLPCSPTATFPEIFIGLFFRRMLWICVQNLKFVALPIPEINAWLVSSVPRSSSKPIYNLIYTVFMGELSVERTGLKPQTHSSYRPTRISGKKLIFFTKKFIVHNPLCVHQKGQRIRQNTHLDFRDSLSFCPMRRETHPRYTFPHSRWFIHC